MNEKEYKALEEQHKEIAKKLANYMCLKVKSEVLSKYSPCLEDKFFFQKGGTIKIEIEDSDKIHLDFGKDVTNVITIESKPLVNNIRATLKHYLELEQESVSKRMEEIK